MQPYLQDIPNPKDLINQLSIKRQQEQHKLPTSRPEGISLKKSPTRLKRISPLNMTKLKNRADSPGLKKAIRFENDPNLETERWKNESGKFIKNIGFDPKKLIEYEIVIKEIFIQDTKQLLMEEPKTRARAEIVNGLRKRLKDFFKIQHKEIEKMIRQVTDFEMVGKLNIGV